MIDEVANLIGYDPEIFKTLSNYQSLVEFYYEKIQKVREADVYHKALCYCLGMNEDTRRNVDRIYNTFHLSQHIPFFTIGSVYIAHHIDDTAILFIQYDIQNKRTN